MPPHDYGVLNESDAYPGNSVWLSGGLRLARARAGADNRPG
jgi:hypothetical protein